MNWPAFDHQEINGAAKCLADVINPEHGTLFEERNGQKHIYCATHTCWHPVADDCELDKFGSD